jgi:hypothetical protein
LTDVTLSEFAYKLGISRAGVTYWRRRGIFEKAIKKVPGKKRILLDYKKALAAYKKNVDPAYNRAGQQKKKKPQKVKDRTGGGNGTGKKKASGDQSFADARAESEKYKALNSKLKYEIELSKWVPRDLVYDEIFRASRICRDTLSNLPARLAPLVTVCNDEQKNHDIIHKEIKATVDDFLSKLAQVKK